jgi:hypothetical protein
MSQFTRFSFIILAGTLITSLLVACSADQTTTSAPTTGDTRSEETT